MGWWIGVLFAIGSIFFTSAAFLQYVQTVNAPHAITARAGDRFRFWTWEPGRIDWTASGLAWFEISHGWWSWRLRSLSWRIAALNLTGSIAFGVSAVPAKVVTTTGEPRNIMLVNLGTAVGGLCFLVGALLLLPERTHVLSTTMP